VIGDLATRADAAGRPLPAWHRSPSTTGAVRREGRRRRLSGNPASPPFRYFDSGACHDRTGGAAVADLRIARFNGSWRGWRALPPPDVSGQFAQPASSSSCSGPGATLTWNRSARLITGGPLVRRMMESRIIPGTRSAAAGSVLLTTARQQSMREEFVQLLGRPSERITMRRSERALLGQLEDLSPAEEGMSRSTMRRHASGRAAGAPRGAPVRLRR